jgi:hypothetical protein
MRKLFCIMLSVGWCAAAMGQPADVSRVLRTIDFEERRLGNDEDLPMHWLKLEGDGLPPYVNGKLASDRAHSGTWSFRFTLDGGSLIYRYDPDQLPVQYQAHYRMTAWVSTTPMAHARARITAYFTDRDMHAIPGSITHSDVYAAENDQVAWKQLQLEMTATDSQATYLAIELELVQPRFYQTSALGNRALFPQDIDGTAWFDDVTVSQVPEVKLETDKPGNIFRFNDDMRMTVTVNDRFTQDLASQLVIKDGTGAVVYKRSGALEPPAKTNLAPGVRRTIIALPDLHPGWYEANLVMTSQGQLVGEQHLDFVRLADNALGSFPDGRFGIIATHMPIESWGQLPGILPVLSAGRVKLAVWNSQWDVQEDSEQSTRFDGIIQALEAVGITPTACLVDLPPSVTRPPDAAPVDDVSQGLASSTWNESAVGSGVESGRSWLRLLTADPRLWQPPLAYLMSRHAVHLDRWQLGDDETNAFVADPHMRQVYDKVYEQFAKLIDKPDLAMPWPAWYDVSGPMPPSVALWVPPSILPSELPLYIQDINSRQGSDKRHSLSLSLALLDRDRYGREAQVRDLVQRVTYALAAGADRIDLPMPMTVRRQGQTWIVEPQETFMVIRTLVRTLGGAVFKGKVPAGDGVEAFLFDRAGRGLLVLWSKGDRSGLVHMDLNLGPRPMRQDMWGNVTPLLQPTTRQANASDGSSHVDIDLGAMPMILTDIDAPVAQIRASVGLDQPLLESIFQPHQRKIHFVNSYPDAINGTLRLRPPPGWVVNPPTFSYSLQPGETFDRPITIEFPYNTLAGPKQIMGDFQIQDVTNGRFTVPIPLSLGLSDVGMQTLALRDHNDVVVQQLITNYSEKPVDYIAFAVYPGQARQERLITKLDAGKTIMKVYRFQNVTIGPDAKVRTGLKEAVGSRILNDSVPVQ